MPSRNDKWDEIKQEADVTRNGRRIIKKVTLEKRKWPFNLKDTFDLFIKLAGLGTIYLSFQQMTSQQKQFQDASAIQTAQFNRQLDANRAQLDSNMLNSKRDRNAAALQKEMENRFQIYEQAVSDVEALLAPELSVAEFHKLYRKFREMSPKIFLVSNDRLALALTKMINQLSYYSEALKYSQVIDSVDAYTKRPFQIFGNAYFNARAGYKFRGDLAYMTKIQKATRGQLDSLGHAYHLLETINSQRETGLLFQSSTIFTNLNFFLGPEAIKKTSDRQRNFLWIIQDHFSFSVNNLGTETKNISVNIVEPGFRAWQGHLDSVRGDLKRMLVQLDVSKNSVRELMRQSINSKNTENMSQ